MSKSIRVHLACILRPIPDIQRATRFPPCVGSTHAAKERSMNIPQAAENAIKGTRARDQRWGAAGLCRLDRGLPFGVVLELLLCWLVSRTYKLYCSGSKVALGLSLRARLLAPPLATAARKYLRYANYDA